MKKNTFGVTTSVLSGFVLAVLFACNSETMQLNSIDKKIINTTQNNLKLSPYSIRGSVQFLKSGFKTKANFEDLSYGSSVSLKDISGNTLGNTNSTTDTSGHFSISPNNFTPEKGKIYILEAIKRPSINQTDGTPLVSIRTFITWNGVSYNSITGSNIYINTYTTALTIIADNSEITRDSTIENILVSGNTGIPKDIDADNKAGTVGVNYNKILRVANLVQQSILYQVDPLSTIKLNAGVYSLNGFDATSSLAKGFTQRDRVGIAGINTLINGYNGFTKKSYDKLGMTKEQRDTAKDLFNSRSPADDINNYRTFWASTINDIFPDLTKNLNGQKKSAELAALFTPNVLSLNMNIKTSYENLNGRKLDDNAIDDELKMISGNLNANDSIEAEFDGKKFKSDFPYLASAW